MDFELTDDQRRIRDVAREFAEAELGDKIAPYDERHEFPHAIVAKLGRARLPRRARRRRSTGGRASTTSRTRSSWRS